MAAPGFHFTEQGGRKISRREFTQLAKAYGLPANAFWQIAKGESGHMPLVQQHDPGDGNVGYGLFQLTPNAWGNGAAMRKFKQLGGVQGMRDVRNQFEMARFLYKATGKSFSPWHGTRFLTDRSGEGTLGPRRPGLVGKATPAPAPASALTQALTRPVAVSASMPALPDFMAPKPSLLDELLEKRKRSLLGGGASG